MEDTCIGGDEISLEVVEIIEGWLTHPVILYRCLKQHLTILYKLVDFEKLLVAMSCNWFQTSIHKDYGTLISRKKASISG